MTAFLTALFTLFLVQDAPAEDNPLRSFEPQGFVTDFTIAIEAPVEIVFDAATGDVTPWWDHSFWPDPAEMVIEPVLGGRFYERFETGSDNGVLHARVIFVNAPNTLRLHGPLGLSGRAFDMVTTWTLAESETGGTDFTVEIHMAGEIDAEMAGIVRNVWIHFIDERLRVWIEAGCHETPDAPCAAFE